VPLSVSGAANRVNILARIFPSSRAGLHRAVHGDARRHDDRHPRSRRETTVRSAGEAARRDAEPASGAGESYSRSAIVGLIRVGERDLLLQYTSRLARIADIACERLFRLEARRSMRAHTTSLHARRCVRQTPGPPPTRR
jgi:hypothetical protein